VSEYGHKLQFDESGLAICPESQQEYKLDQNTVKRVK
jgi:UDP-2-acetamido-3-amino-2,3-dideoxy-glucuronate N-acetyltransferase